MPEFSKTYLEPAWCPGCGNFSIREAVLKALNDSGLKKREVAWVSGIGQAAKMPHYIETNFFNGLHGRSLPAATGLKLANPWLNVIVESGEGCHYGEGGNHYLAALRRNIGLTVLVHDNQIYGLTKGQASPTTEVGQATKSTPQGVFNQPFRPLTAAVSAGAGYVARGFSGEIDHLAQLILEAVLYPGLAVVDILMPCVSFNKVGTFAWYKSRVQKLPESYNPKDKSAALATAEQWGEKIPIGLIYWRDPSENPPLERKIAAARGRESLPALAGNPPQRAQLEAIMNKLVY
ncbi:MAG: 2-oxoacid:ferredoxin oxidoreductase subunit beta [Candidatus Adiutrix sp.]|jgi:2-oxoglutarate ferredoxin oxidoreductase subunit beta|nr:2-oxoacid:ferredoxin oxidoreductase subunit beta [Candidatus Adiutrix sp.]